MRCAEGGGPLVTPVTMKQPLEAGVHTPQLKDKNMPFPVTAVTVAKSSAPLVARAAMRNPIVRAAAVMAIDIAIKQLRTLRKEVDRRPAG